MKGKYKWSMPEFIGAVDMQVWDPPEGTDIVGMLAWLPEKFTCICLGFLVQRKETGKLASIYLNSM